MASTKEAIVICLDIGPSMRRNLDDEEMTPLQTALECISWILQRRIFVESKDEIALILFGTTDTDNPLAEDGQYEHISVVRDLQLVDFDFVKMVEKIPQDSESADFVDALVVALDVLHNGTQGKKFAQKTIVMMSNLDSEFADDQIDQIINTMKEEGIEFAAIGPSGGDGDDDDETSASAKPHRKITSQQKAGEKIVKSIVEAVDGTCLQLNEALPMLSFFSQRQVKPTAWKCNLEIGSEIRIPLNLYVKTKEYKIKQSWKWMNAQDASAEINIERTFHKKEDNDDGEDNDKGGMVNGAKADEDDDAKAEGDEIEKEEVIKAYKYGSTLVPLDKFNLETAKYKSGGKCFQLLSFTDEINIKRHYFMGDSVRVAIADPNDPTACVALSAFVKAMMEAKLNGLVRFAYNVLSSPRVGALIPDIDENGSAYLIYVALPFSEDCRFFNFPTLNSDRLKPSDDQNSALDMLISSMDLTQAIVDKDGKRKSFDSIDVVNPQIQYAFRCMQHRIMYPNSPLPEPTPQLLAPFSPIQERVNLAQPAFAAMKKHFKLEKVVTKDKRTAADVFKTKDEGPPEKVAKTEEDVPSTAAADEPQEDQVKIGTTRPVEDFLHWVKRNEANFDVATEKLTDIVKKFVFDGVGSQLYSKAIDCLESLRKMSVELNKPGPFNRFISIFKTVLLDKGKDDFWKEICTNNLGLICDDESPSSQVKKSEAEEFLKEEEKKTISAPIGDVEESQENLLDELE